MYIAPRGYKQKRQWFLGYIVVLELAWVFAYPGYVLYTAFIDGQLDAQVAVLYNLPWMKWQYVATWLGLLWLIRWSFHDHWRGWRLVFLLGLIVGYSLGMFVSLGQHITVTNVNTCTC